jgi:flagellar motor switch protein FliN/FliY
MSGSNSKNTEQQGATAQVLSLGELAQRQTGPALPGNGLGVFEGVPVSVKVVVGTAHSTIGEIMALREHTLLKLDRHVDLPVDVVLNGKVIARGELLAVDDNFGVRITELASLGASL